MRDDGGAEVFTEQDHVVKPQTPGRRSEVRVRKLRRGPVESEQVVMQSTVDLEGEQHVELVSAAGEVEPAVPVVAGDDDELVADPCSGAHGACGTNTSWRGHAIRVSPHEAE